ncbi:hypothetical protein COT72_00920 [archaeon CG10_big_fil_rev_8_21_14_0_10_43_11]|nr:MAG: hypothetical protein COT72_00920 [archaeon CG10_big_fil_rev_8_21_14_0_10_43_11]
MKHQQHVTYLILLLFVLANVFGLWVAHYYTTNALPFGIERLSDEGLFSLSTFLFALLAMTLVILVLIRYKKILLWKIMYGVGIGLAMAITLNIFFGETGLLVAGFLLLLKLRSHDAYFHNITEILIYGGVVAIIAPMFNPTTAVLLLAIVSLYDTYAVRVSKHMVTLAKAQSTAGVFPGIIVEQKNSASFLGGGDIAFPLLLASVFAGTSLITSAFIIGGAANGLLFLLTRGKKGTYYPAMPFISVGAMLGMIVSIAFV